MAGTTFENINLAGSTFHDIDFSDVMFTAAQIGGTTFKHIGPPPDPDDAIFEQRPVTFLEGMLTGSTFSHFDLRNVEIIHCDIEGMKVDGVLLSDMVDLWKQVKSGD